VCSLGSSLDLRLPVTTATIVTAAFPRDGVAAVLLADNLIAKPQKTTVVQSNSRLSGARESVWNTMPWVVRGQRRYFYASVRRDGRVTRQFCGSGPAAELVASLTTLRRLDRKRAVEAARAEAARWRLVADEVEELDCLVNLLVGIRLRAGGFHRPGRHRWRRRRGKSNE
jgi:hypothetical protein